MRCTTLPLLAVSLLVAIGCAGSSSNVGGPAHFSFDTTRAGELPAGLTSGGSTEGGPPRWAVVPDDTAPSGTMVLEQSDPTGEEPRYAVVLADAPVARDVRVSVRCKPLTGRLDRSAGLVFRATSDRDYYVVRANLLEKDVRLDHCVNGMRTEIAAWQRRLAAGRWHTLEAEVRGDHILVRWNGEIVIDVHDTTLGTAGRAGLWTKADSVTRFDDLTITPL